jgi:hypothetical protein
MTHEHVLIVAEVSMKSSLLKNSLVSLLSLFTFNSALADGNREEKSGREGRGTYVVVKPPLLLAAGLDVGTYVGENKALGLTVDIDSYVVMTTGFAGPYLRLFTGKSFYLQNAIGVFKNSLSNEYVGIGLNSTIGNEWLFDSGLIIGGEWFGLSLMESVNKGETIVRKAVLPTMPKFRIGYAF